MTAFPQYRLSDLDNMRRKEYLRLLAMATWSLQAIRGIKVALIPLDDEHGNQPQPGQPQVPPQHRRMGAMPPFTSRRPS